MGTKTLKWLWKYSDAICFLAAIIVLNVTAFHAGFYWFGITLALSLIVVGLALEYIARQKGGDN